MSETISVPPSSSRLQTTSLSSSASKKRARQASTDASNGTNTTKGMPKGPKTSTDAGIAKPKQSKSRNGCVTCKAKRLKCDETKPKCENCKKRNVECGGYKKDYKWRAFEEQSFAPKMMTVNLPNRPPCSTVGAASEFSFDKSPDSTQNGAGPSYAHPTPKIPDTSSKRHSSSTSPVTTQSSPENNSASSGSFDFFQNPRFNNDGQFSHRSGLNPPYDQDLYSHFNPSYDPSQRRFSGRSPTLSELLLPGTDLNTGIPASDAFVSEVDQLCHQNSLDQDHATLLGSNEGDENDVEEVLRDADSMGTVENGWTSMSPFLASHMAEECPPWSQTNPFGMMYKEPQFLLGSPEMLTARFDRNTCGIMSTRDGPTENPWRTLIWPLAHDCPALFHAIASMSSFHAARSIPALRVHGMHHMQSSINALRMAMGTIKVETALATTIALAFSESWDQHISTGINHVKGGRALVKKALFNSPPPTDSADVARLKFLGKMWVYIDVIARLTSPDDEAGNEFDDVSSMIPEPVYMETELDPLMGVGSTLFPLVGKAAHLVQRVCRVKANSPAIITSAMQLKQALETWQPADYYPEPEDPSTSVEHSRQTAEAYRWATLLYLHQAVPEIRSPSSAELAQRTLMSLAMVPMSSRAVIVHIYPLLAAGCEAATDVDREWVQSRWEELSRRMCIGNIDRCSDVVKEVWRRRDEYEMRMQSHRMSSPTSFNLTPGQGFGLDEYSSWSHGLDNNRKELGHGMDSGYGMRNSFGSSGGMGALGEESDGDVTVRSDMHWVGVMREWNWEVLLG